MVHLAAQAGVRYSLEAPQLTHQNNIEAFLNILEGCRHNQISRLVYASSSSVLVQGVAFLRITTSGPPYFTYAATKKAIELMAHTYSPIPSLKQLDCVSLRYGPKGRPDMAQEFTDAIINNRPIKVFDNGKMRRDHHIDDIVEGNFRRNLTRYA